MALVPMGLAVATTTACGLLWLARLPLRALNATYRWSWRMFDDRAEAARPTNGPRLYAMAASVALGVGAGAAWAGGVVEPWRAAMLWGWFSLVGAVVAGWIGAGGWGRVRGWGGLRGWRKGAGRAGAGAGGVGGATVGRDGGVGGGGTGGAKVVSTARGLGARGVRGVRGAWSATTAFTRTAAAMVIASRARRRRTPVTTAE